jgi:hypothetical protein
VAQDGVVAVAQQRHKTARWWRRTVWRWRSSDVRRHGGGTGLCGGGAGRCGNGKEVRWWLRDVVVLENVGWSSTKVER